MSSEERRVPELRFIGFHDDWEQRKLKDITELITKGTTPRIKSVEGIVNFIKIENIDHESGDISLNSKITIDEHEGYLRRSILKNDDILFSIAGSIGKIAIIQEDHLPANTNQALAIIRLQSSNKNFIATLLSGKTVIEYIRRNPTIGAQPNLSLKQVSDLSLFLPNIEEQNQVGQLFLRIDKLINLHQQKSNILKEIKHELLEELFPIGGNIYPKIRFTSYTNKWNKLNIKDYMLERNERSSDGELISVTIDSGVLKTKSLNRKDNSSKDKSNYKIVKKGDIPYNSMRMWQGASGLSPFDGILSPAYTVLVPKRNVSGLYFSYLFKSKDMLNQFQKYSQGLTSDTWNLKYPLLKDIKVSAPDFVEQQTIGIFFSELDRNINLHQKKVNTLNKLKELYLHKMFL